MRGHTSAQRSVQATVRSATSGLTCSRAQCMPLLVLTVTMSEVSPRASLTPGFADLNSVFGLICRLVRAAIPSKC
jgi:hypothetical protein